MAFTELLDHLFQHPELAALRGRRLPVQESKDVDLAETVDVMAYVQRTELWRATRGARFKKNTRKWEVGVVATCVGFTLGEALGRGKPFVPENREHMRRMLELAQVGAGSLLKPGQDLAALGARGARVLEAATTRGGIKVKSPLDLMPRLALAWRVSVESLDRFDMSSAEYMRVLP